MKSSVGNVDDCVECDALGEISNQEHTACGTLPLVHFSINDNNINL